MAPLDRNQLSLCEKCAMAEIVVDASALAALIFREPEGEAVLHRCQGESLFAPQLLDYEMANICVTKQRRDRTRAALLARQFHAYTNLDLELEPVDIEAVQGLANQLKVTAYDAAYLWLARDRGRALVTLDKALARAYSSW